MAIWLLYAKQSVKTKLRELGDQPKTVLIGAKTAVNDVPNPLFSCQFP